jgi:error-prone DNA polymerase
MAEVELHVRSCYSFYLGASHPHELLLRARELGISALGLADVDGLAGALKFALSARAMGIRPIIGAELTLEGGGSLVLLCQDANGYRHLSRLISLAHRGDRRRPSLPLEAVLERSGGLACLLGRRSPVASLLLSFRHDEARAFLRRLWEAFGERLYLEASHHLLPTDDDFLRGMARLSRETGLRVVASSDAFYHHPSRKRLLQALAAIRHRTPLDALGEGLPRGERSLKSRGELLRLLPGLEGALREARELAEACRLELPRDLEYRFPEPPEVDALRELRLLCEAAARRRYGDLTPRVRERLERELSLIERHRLAGFFLLYHRIAQEARQVLVDLGLREGELPLEVAPVARGRGSSVAMLVGYLVGLSHIDPLEYDLGLERFLPGDRLVRPPDIDLDLPREAREELIRRLLALFGEGAALVGMTVTYRLRGAVRDLGFALSLPREVVDRLAKGLVEGEPLPEQVRRLGMAGLLRERRFRLLLELSGELVGLPRGIAQHPGGMVMSYTPLHHLCPVVPAAQAGRRILQWDKDDIEDAGVLKVDLLSLGALSQLEEALRLIGERWGEAPDLSRIDYEDKEVYDMLSRGDTIGVFQVESAAQRQTITRLRPRSLYDLALEVACVRPGVGVQGGVRTFLRRRHGLEPVTYLHPLEEPVLARTLGVVLFQDQVNGLAMAVAGLSPAEAEELRRAFSRRHNRGLIEYWRGRFVAGAEEKGVPREVAEAVFARFSGEYMFPEGHAVAFAVTAYQLAWLKRHYPAEFYCSLLNAQPMGFYDLETVKEDARRHGVSFLPPHVNASAVRCRVEGEGTVRLGLAFVRGLGEELARRVVEERGRGGPYRDVWDLAGRTGLPQGALVALADAGALDGLSPSRATARAQAVLAPPLRGGMRPLPLLPPEVELPPFSHLEEALRELSSLSLLPGVHLLSLLRPLLPPWVMTAAEASRLPHGTRAAVAGRVIRRQRPASTRALFLSLEDETGDISCLVTPRAWERLRAVLVRPLLLVWGVIERTDGALNLRVLRAQELTGAPLRRTASHDLR